MRYTLLFLLFFTHMALACEVQLPHQLIIFNEDNSGQSAYLSKNCATEITNDLHHIVSKLEGRVASYQLKEMMSARGHAVEISPPSINIHQFKTMVRNQLPLPTGIQVKSTQSVNMSGSLALAAGDKVEISCSSCLYGSQQMLNVAIIGFDGSKQTFFARADFRKMVKAYRLNSSLPSFSSLNETSLLNEEYIESIPHTDLITDMDSLKFYKTNKPLRTGEILKRSDLNAINLVKAGLKTDVILENEMVRIKTSGISRSNGTIGDLVEVFHPQKNKKYQGKVIGVNKVLVEL
jgi:flagella basal body P-ring formation protein FlgA